MWDRVHDAVGLIPMRTTDDKGRPIPNITDEHKRFVKDSISLAINDEQARAVKEMMDADWHVREVAVYMVKIADDKSVLLDAVYSSGQRKMLME
jgi:hypothetical protein